MHQSQGDAPLAIPNPAARAYNSIIRRTESPRDIEFRVFTQVTAALEGTASPDAPFAARIKAVHRNRELWQTLAYDLADEGNVYPIELKAKLISLAIWVTRESTRVLEGIASLDALINVNKSIMQGLRPSAQGAA
jgi:flagellar protein FlaF